MRTQFITTTKQTITSLYNENHVINNENYVIDTYDFTQMRYYPPFHYLILSTRKLTYGSRMKEIHNKLFNIEKQQLTDISFSDPQITHDSSFIFWSPFGQKVCVNYEKDGIRFHGIGMLDINSGVISDVKIFKHYQIVPHNRFSQFSWLSWVNEDIIKYVFWSGEGDLAELIEHNLKTNEVKTLASLNIFKSYFCCVRQLEQLSPDGQEIVYVELFTHDILVSSLDGCMS